MKPCRLHNDLEIVAGSQADWRQLARFHYRPGRPGAVDQVFALRYRAEKIKADRSLIGASLGVIGVIVYAMPMANSGLRHQATGRRYLVGNTRERMVLLNREMRTISRVVIHPQFRGIGLAARLVRETLKKAGTVYVEAQAAMGQVNPFFEKASMTRYHKPPAASTLRLQAVAEQVGLTANLFYDPAQLERALQSLKETDHDWFVGEMVRFGQGFGKSFKNIERSVAGLSGFVASHLSGESIYYLWRNPCK